MSKLAARTQTLENLSMLLNSGVSTGQAVLTSMAEIKDKKTAKKLQKLTEKLHDGVSFSLAFQQSNLFPAYAVRLIKAGEQTGKLPENLGLAAQQMNRELLFRTKLRSALLYPIIILGLGVLVAGGIAIFILPQLADTFAGIPGGVPAITQGLINVGEYIQRRPILSAVVIFGVPTAITLAVLASAKLRIATYNLLMKLPGLRKLLLDVELARFGYVTGTMLDSGISINEIFESLIETSTTKEFRNQYRLFHDGLLQGWGFARIFKEQSKDFPLFTPSTRQMIIAAEQSGQLANTFLRIGKRYESGLDDSIKDFAAILEPILLILVALMVGAIAIAVVLPIYSLVGNF